jgi:hypothetical protein
MKNFLALILFSGSLLFLTTGCNRDKEYVATANNVPSGMSFLKVNFNSSYAANPGVQFAVNKTRVSGLVTSRTPYPGGGYNTGGNNYPDYLSVNPGNIEFGVAIPKKNTNADSVVLLTKTLNLAADKHYTLHITDTGANTKSVLVEDNLTLPANNTARFKFVNMVPNVAAIDLYYGTTIVAANIPLMGVSSDFVIPFPSTANPLQTWSIREAGSLPTSTALATYNSANTVLNQRVYTAFAVGYKGATDNIRKPYISFLLNR